MTNIMFNPDGIKMDHTVQDTFTWSYQLHYYIFLSAVNSHCFDAMCYKLLN